MVELSRLLPSQPGVLRLGPVIDQVGDQEGGHHGEERAPEKFRLEQCQAVKLNFNICLT